MTQRISRVSVLQTSYVLAVVYAIIGLVATPFLWIASLVDPSASLPIWMAAVIPVFYGVIGFFTTALMLAVYNLIASFTGGIEVTFEPRADSAGA